MSIKLFILGRPGSGKSTTYRFILEFLGYKYNDWPITHHNDYDILQQLFQHEQSYPPKNARFEAKELDGFDVVDFTVLDEVLGIIENDVQVRSAQKKQELVIIEFARQDYEQAFRVFSSSFLKDSYFLFLDADIQTCIQRVNDRITVPPTRDNHFVSENILTGYYSKQKVPGIIKASNGEIVDNCKVKIVSNRGSLEEFNDNLEDFIDDFLLFTASILQKRTMEQTLSQILAILFQPLFFDISF